MDSKLAFTDAITKPVEVHVNRVVTSLFDGVINDSFSTGVVSMYGSCWLFPTHWLKGGADDTTTLGIVEEDTDFGFGGGGKEIEYDVGNNMDGTIEQRVG